MRNPIFDDIRPYYEEEIPAAMQRITESPFFPLIASFVYPDEDLDIVRKRVTGFKTVRDFQVQAMYTANEQIIKRSMTSFSCSGLERLSQNRNYLYVSNHRDIMLDASLLQNCLVDRGFDTTEITFGANLMHGQTVIDIGKSNKMFKVERPNNNIKDFYRSSMHLSEYIRNAITRKHQSVWIAQRNGRTKNGIDATDQGIIKMFCMSDDTDKIKALADLNIVPVSISYEWESCDILKTLELYESRYTQYIKKPGEDLNSILTGILQPKGQVHIEICHPITLEELETYEPLTNSEYHKAIAKLVDKRINNAYRLYPNNYIAHDIRFGNKKYQDKYTRHQKDKFTAYMGKLEKYETCDMEQLADIFLSIYSNPIDNK